MHHAILARSIDALLWACAAWCLTMAACGPPSPGETVLDCYSIACPSADDVSSAVESFDERRSLESVAPLLIEWHAAGETFGGWYDERGYHQIVGLTVNRDRVKVSSWALLAHELMHIHHWRISRTPDDAYHAEAPGPWTLNDDLVIEELRVDFEQRFTPAE